MGLTTPEQFEAYETVMKMLDDAIESGNIEGRKFSKERNGRFQDVALLCIKLFKGYPTNAEIIVDKVTNNKPFFGVKVHTDEFLLDSKNRDEFIELLNLADNVVFMGDEQDYFHMTFYVNDIWTE